MLVDLSSWNEKFKNFQKSQKDLPIGWILLLDFHSNDPAAQAIQGAERGAALSASGVLPSAGHCLFPVPVLDRNASNREEAAVDVLFNSPAIN
jgi:hypothetical protein